MIAAIALFYIPEKMRDISEVRMALVVGGLMSIGFAVWAIRTVTARVHKGPAIRAGLYLGVVVGAIVVAETIAYILGHFGPFEGTVEGAKLRLVVSAVVLIVLMLIRPQGVFAHHEFSWSWVKRLFGKETPRTEVAA